MKEDCRDARRFLASGQILFFKSSSMMLTSLTAKSTAVICLSSSLHQIGAHRQICVCTCQQMACSGIPFGFFLLSYSAKLPPCWAVRDMVWVVKECREISLFFVWHDSSAEFTGVFEVVMASFPCWWSQVHFNCTQASASHSTGTSKKGVVL